MELCLSRRSEANQHKAPRFRSEPTEELKAPGNVWEFGQWTSILVTHSLHPTPVFLIHGSYRAFREQKGYISFLIFQFTWLIFIPPQFFSWWGKGRPSWTEGNRVAICHRPHMAWGKLEGGQPQRAASHQGQLRRGVCIQAVMLGPDYRTTRLWWGWWLFKSSDILKGSRWALSIWKAQCYLSMHALQAPFPNMFSSSQGRVHFLPSFRFQPRSPPPRLA